MTTRKKTQEQIRRSYPDEYKTEAVVLAEQAGTTAATKKLGIRSSHR